MRKYVSDRGLGGQLALEVGLASMAPVFLRAVPMGTHMDTVHPEPSKQDFIKIANLAGSDTWACMFRTCWSSMLAFPSSPLQMSAALGPSDQLGSSWSGCGQRYMSQGMPAWWRGDTLLFRQPGKVRKHDDAPRSDQHASQHQSSSPMHASPRHPPAAAVPMAGSARQSDAGGL